METRKLTNFKWLNLYEKVHKLGTWTYASRTNNIDKPDAVVIVPYIGEKLVITKEYRFSLEDYEYSFPAGLIDENETPEEAARRELKEETGLDIRNIRHISPMLYPSSGLTNESVVIIIADVDGEITQDNLQGGEIIETFIMDKNQIRELYQNNVRFNERLWLILHSVLT